ncbi:MAG TPA: serine protease [Gemmataceae bacterium]
MAQALCLLFVFGQLADSEDFPKAMQERALAATVRIVNRTRRIEGSGVLIGRKDKSTFILTASHLLERGDRLEISTFSVKSYPDPDKVYSKAELVAFAKDMRDLALIRLTIDNPPAGSLVLCPPKLLPKDKEFEALSVGCGAGAIPLCLVENIKGTKQIRRSERMKPALCWESDSEQSPGRSGGPLLDRQGRVIGVASGVNEGKGYYAHADEIQRWLKSTDFSFLVEEKDAPRPQQPPAKSAVR